MDEQTLGTFVDPESGELERRSPADGWDMPTLERIKTRRGPVLRFHSITPGEGLYSDLHPQVAPGSGYLEAFLNLESDDDICEYAERWGALTLCQHQDTGLRHRIPPPSGEYTPEPTVDTGPIRKAWFDESTDLWRAVIARADGILTIARAINEGDTGPIAAWRTIEPDMGLEVSGEEDDEGDDPVGLTLYFARSTLAAGLNRWLATSHVMPRLDWSSTAVPQYMHRVGGLSGAIAHDLLLAVTSSTGLYVCFLCGRSYFREKRRPKPGQRNYCPEHANRQGYARGQNRRGPRPRQGARP